MLSTIQRKQILAVSALAILGQMGPNPRPVASEGPSCTICLSDGCPTQELGDDACWTNCNGSLMDECRYSPLLADCIDPPLATHYTLVCVK